MTPASVPECVAVTCALVRGPLRPGNETTPLVKSYIIRLGIMMLYGIIPMQHGYNTVHVQDHEEITYMTLIYHLPSTKCNDTLTSGLSL